MSETSRQLLDRLCRNKSYRFSKGGPGEEVIAQEIALVLAQYSWLNVSVDSVCDADGHVVPGCFNVVAFDGDPKDTQWLITGHIDTVTPSPGWTKEEYSFDETRYYALGAIDTKGGIAACLEAIGQAGPTKGVAYLFYGDEEVGFLGMQDFVRRYPHVSPRFGLSLCGGRGEVFVGWRGCTEMEFLIEGVSGHASRPQEGANAAEVLSMVMETVRTACLKQTAVMETSVNIAAMHAGSSDGLRGFSLGVQEAPPMKNVANKIPNIAWALLDVRPGGSEISAAFIQEKAEQALAFWNKERTVQATLHVKTNFEMASYLADQEAVAWMIEGLAPIHEGRLRDPGKTGFLDVTMIAQAHGTQFICLSPKGRNAHACDEYVDVASMERYAQTLTTLLKRYQSE